MHLDARGHPLHTRALSVTLAQRADGALDALGYVLDLRKRGFVPIAGDLQGSGIIHDMRLAGVVDPGTGTLQRLGAEQRHVAFEPSPSTGGECCRDPVGRVGELAGARLDASFAGRLSEEIGGPRGCSHVLTLGHLLGSTAAWALARDRTLHGPAPARPADQRVFRRDLVIDGHEPAAGHLQLVAQLTDLHFAPSPVLALPMDRFAEEREVRALVDIDLAGFSIERVTAAERRRGLAELEEARWRSRNEATAWLPGVRLGPGITGKLLARLSEHPEDRPLLDLLLMLAPALVQCYAALSESWPLTARANPSFVGMGALPDSCYMWRRGGALLRARETENTG